MPTQTEFNIFRRLVGDFESPPKIVDADLDGDLDDAAYDYSSRDYWLDPVTTFDAIPATRKIEVIYYAAIQWWWNRAAQLADKHTQTVGQASQNVGEKWDRAMQMIAQLETQLAAIVANIDVIKVGNNSRFSKVTLTRLGGVEEEAARDGQ